ncbi:MAG: hypothetical protein E6J41_27845 [Chloroflexi bacterium]|nr:MAG: hypothetical protein E6J41_27845 [Chloroflexota bacterium]
MSATVIPASAYVSHMPELPELEALRLQLGPRLEGRLVTAVDVNPKSGHLLRYPPDSFAEELPYRKFTRTWRRGKHLVFDLKLARGGELRHLAINPMLGGRFQLAGPDTKAPATRVFSLRLDGGDELRYLDFRDMGRIYWTADPAADVLAWREMGPEATCSATRRSWPASATRTRTRSCGRRSCCRCAGARR